MVHSEELAISICHDHYIHQIYPPKFKNHKNKYYTAQRRYHIGLPLSHLAKILHTHYFLSVQRYSKFLCVASVFCLTGTRCWATIFLDIATNLKIRKVRTKSFFCISKENIINYLKLKQRELD